MANTTIEITGGMFDSTEVTETVDGFPVGNRAVGSDFFAKMISTLYRNGVSAGDGLPDSFLVVPGGGMNLICSAGTAWINGYMAWNREDRKIPAAAGNRYLVLLRLDLLAGMYTIRCVENPEDGAYPVRNDTVYDLVLAKVSVPADAEDMTEAVITDCRYDEALCGVVTSAADGLNAIAFAAAAGSLGGYTAEDFLRLTGGIMTGRLLAAAENTGLAAVRNISYGTVLPENLAEGEIFILLT